MPEVLHWPLVTVTATCATAASAKLTATPGVPLPLTMEPPVIDQAYAAPSTGATDAVALPNRQPASNYAVAGSSSLSPSAVGSASMA